MEDIQSIKGILDFLMRPAVEWNAPQKSYWGVAIKNHSVFVASAFFMLRIDNIPEAQEEGFYSYVNNKFEKGEYCFPLTEDQLKDRLSSMSSFVGKVRFPVTNILNRLAELDKVTTLKKCRVVISHGMLESDELMLKFKKANGRWIFNYPGIPMQITRDENKSVVPEEFMKENVVYRCSIISESDTSATVNVIEPFGKMRLGILYSEKGFDPKNIEDVNRMTEYIRPDMIICSDDIEPDEIPAPPIHLDASLLNDILKAFLLCSDKIDIHLPDDPNKPVMITSVPRENQDKELAIHAFIATLNPFCGAQRR